MIMMTCCEASRGRYLPPCECASSASLHLPQHTEPQLCPAALLQTCPQALTCRAPPNVAVLSKLMMLYVPSCGCLSSV